MIGDLIINRKDGVSNLFSRPLERGGGTFGRYDLYLTFEYAYKLYDINQSHSYVFRKYVK